MIHPQRNARRNHMRVARSALFSHLGRILVALSVLSALVVAGTAAASPPGNFVSVFVNGPSSCTADLHPSNGENDAREEAAAGRAAVGLGTFAGVTPEGSNRPCHQTWTP